MDDQYKGMTVNERLYISGLMEKFDLAIKNKNVEEVIDILKKVEITDKSAIKAILKEFGLIEKF